MSPHRAYGFYAHHHGRGHLSRVAEICRALGPARCTVATSRTDAHEVLPSGTDLQLLPIDVPPPGADPGDVTAGGALHWAPTHPVQRERTAALLEWVAARRPAVVVVDVSVEVALAVRLAGTPVVVVRLHGDRRDPPHELAHQIADHLLAPFPAALEHPSTPPHVLARTVHTGFVTPARERTTDTSVAGDARRVLVAWGQGSPPPPATALDAAAERTPEWEWHMIGPDPEGCLRSVRHHGWVPDPFSHMAAAAVVVGPPGDGLLGDVAAAGVPLVATCEPRPFGEHHHKAEVLEAVGAAVAVDGWPAPASWPALLARASGIAPDALAPLGTDGAHVAAEVLRSAVRRERVRA